MGLVSTEGEAKKFKGKATEIMSKGKFPLGKWESNIEVLNDDKERVKAEVLGVGWNKKDDTLAVEIEINVTTTISKRTMLDACKYLRPRTSYVPNLVEGKYLYRLAVDERRSWDNEVSIELKEKWVKWQHGLQNIKVPRSIALYLGDITTIVLHHMMDAIFKAASAQKIAIAMKPSGMIQALLTSKSRITKRGLRIARQELVVCVMGANITANRNKALKRWPIIENYCWTESQVALCWIRETVERLVDICIKPCEEDKANN